MVNLRTWEAETGRSEVQNQLLLRPIYKRNGQRRKGTMKKERGSWIGKKEERKKIRDEERGKKGI